MEDIRYYLLRQDLINGKSLFTVGQADYYATYPSELNHLADALVFQPMDSPIEPRDFACTYAHMLASGSPPEKFEGYRTRAIFYNQYTQIADITDLVKEASELLQ